MTKFRDTDAADAYRILISTVALIGVHDVSDVNIVFLANLTQQEVHRLVERAAERDRIIADYQSRMDRMSRGCLDDSTRILELEAALRQVCDSLDSAGALSRRLRAMADEATRATAGSSEDPDAATDKKAAVEEILHPGCPALIHVDARQIGVVVPSQHRATSNLVLRIGYQLNIGHFEVGNSGISGDLSFAGELFHCHLPWRSVFLVASEEDVPRSAAWPQHFPDGVVVADDPPLADPPKDQRGHLRIVE